MHLKNLLLPVSLVSLSVLADVEYTLTIDQPDHHLGNVSVLFPKSAQAHLDVKLPDWRTGRYEVLDLANGIRYFNATDHEGKALKWHKIDKSTWRVHLDDPSQVQVTYQVYANQLAKRVRHIDDSHAFIDASGFFMFSDSFRQEPVKVALDVPKQWRSISGMEFAGNKHTFSAANYDVLVDSPIETGVNEHHKFSVDGREYELVIWGEGNYDVQQMLDDLKKLVKTGSLIWDEYPYRRFVFMVHATSGARGATEHLNSTIIQRHRDTFAKREDYLSFIATAAHEFIHTWNVKNYRPAGLVPYDYLNPNYSDLLWLSEGSTSYLEDYLLLSADIMSHDEFFKNLSNTINRHLDKPGREVQSAAHTSFDKWINQGGDHGLNYSTNIYLEGSLISMALDIDLLANSDGKVSYRDVHKQLYNQYKLPKSFTSKDVKDILKQVSGKDYSQWWQQHVDSPVELDFDTLLDKVGLEFTYPEGAKTIASLAVIAKSEGQLLTLQHVARDSSAWQAGLTAGDKVVAFGGHHVRDSLVDSLAYFKGGDTVKVDFIRRDKLMSTKVKLEQDFDKQKRIQALASPSESQQRLFKAWTGITHPKAQ
ncbi:MULTISPECIES: M61 family metallopeptidase [Pseudoalteromonas]|uniref:Peptidase M61 n=1 Tax=Pseudoalteromonas amylolytica TaxID=1859457 RepID=A0A1S1N389_9GAMM|nr:MULTISPECIES: PDZ domain-containing protein [Pseudoalteromonas]OHU85554.1 peptidase M61 [Pseudoalteromonas sp. JW3]OHU93086.1 peptidase M61 [Pseudoalteromonas amylolytica]